MQSKVSRTPACGYGAMGSLPAHSLARLGRASFTSSSRRASRPCVLAARLRRCEPPPSLVSLRGRMFFDVGSNCSLGSRLLEACPRFHATVPASAQPPVLSSLKVALPGGATRRRVSSMKTRGPRCSVLALVAPRRLSKGGLRWDGGGSHRLAVPGRGSCLLIGVSTGSSVTLTRSKRLDDGRCWTQRRPPAGSSR